MPSAFENLMAGQLAGSLYPIFSLTAVYTAPDGAQTTGVAIRVHRDPPRQVERGNGIIGEVQSGEVMVMRLGGGISVGLAKPVKGGRFMVEGVEVWTIETTPTLKNGEFICSCSRQGVDSMMARRAKDA